MIYENVEKYAKKRGLSIAKLEIQANLSNGTIGKWRKYTPKIESLSKVAKVLNVKVDTLIKE